MPFNLIQSKAKALKMNLKNLVILLFCATAVSSCKNIKLFGKKKEQSDVTGWNYNDKRKSVV